MHYYAGGSARLLQLTSTTVKDILTRMINQVNDMSKLAEEGGVGPSSDEAVNSLMSIYGDETIILSQYVTRMLLDKVSNDLIKKARSVLRNNPSWQGWVTELEVLTMAKGKTEMIVECDGGETEIWKWNGEMQTFETNLDIVRWFRPQKWNHSLFYALFSVSRKELRVIRITHGETNSCKLKYLVPYVVSLGVSVIDFVFVCRRDNFATFQVPSPDTAEITVALDANQKSSKSANSIYIPTERRGERSVAKSVFAILIRDRGIVVSLHAQALTFLFL